MPSEPPHNGGAVGAAEPPAHSTPPVDPAPRIPPDAAPRNPAPKGPGTIWHLLASVALLIAIVWVGLHFEPRANAWVIILVLMAAFALVNGHGITGSPWGILIDSRNKMSLSRLQMLAWTLVVLSTLVTAILTNVARGAAAPMDIAVPQELWVLLGITTAAAVGAPAVLNSRRQKKPDGTELQKTERALQQQGHAPVDTSDDSVVLRNADVRDARFSELLKGDESGNASTVDLGKLQMFFFTFVLVAGYGSAVYSMFLQDAHVTALPSVQEGMNVLLGISQTGYLAMKATGDSKEKS